MITQPPVVQTTGTKDNNLYGKGQGLYYSAVTEMINGGLGSIFRRRKIGGATISIKARYDSINDIASGIVSILNILGEPPEEPEYEVGTKLVYEEPSYEYITAIGAVAESFIRKERDNGFGQKWWKTYGARETIIIGSGYILFRGIKYFTDPIDSGLEEHSSLIVCANAYEGFIYYARMSTSFVCTIYKVAIRKIDTPIDLSASLIGSRTITFQDIEDTYLENPNLREPMFAISGDCSFIRIVIPIRESTTGDNYDYEYDIILSNLNLNGPRKLLRSGDDQRQGIPVTEESFVSYGARDNSYSYIDYAGYLAFSDGYDGADLPDNMLYHTGYFPEPVYENPDNPNSPIIDIIWVELPPSPIYVEVGASAVYVPSGARFYWYDGAIYDVYMDTETGDIGYVTIKQLTPEITTSTVTGNTTYISRPLLKHTKLIPGAVIKSLGNPQAPPTVDFLTQNYFEADGTVTPLSDAFPQIITVQAESVGNIETTREGQTFDLRRNGVSITHPFNSLFDVVEINGQTGSAIIYGYGFDVNSYYQGVKISTLTRVGIDIGSDNLNYGDVTGDIYPIKNEDLGSCCIAKYKFNPYYSTSTSAMTVASSDRNVSLELLNQSIDTSAYGLIK